MDHGPESKPTMRQQWLGKGIGWRGLDDWKVLRDEDGAARAALQQIEAASSARAAAVLDGAAVAAAIRAEIRAGVDELRARTGRAPGLAVVLVGGRRDSLAYVRSKQGACVEAGIRSFGVELPESADEGAVLRAVEELNANPDVHGVLVQLPLPQHMSEERVVGRVSIEKDVDGFHPLNMGRLAMAGREPLFVPCTPRGCVELLLRAGVDLAGRRAAVIGRSNVVGTPTALLLQRHNATVTIVHSHTLNPAEDVRRADIVIAAAGVANLVRAHWVKPGAVVVDVGINPVEDAASERGYRLVGDVCYEEVSKVASALTPVPGGVGPMTIAMLLSNTLAAARRAMSS